MVCSPQGPGSRDPRLTRYLHRGLASTLQAVAFNWAGLMACRWFLAMAEAAFAPGVPYLLSFFYRRRELGLRCGIFLSAAPLATTFAGPSSSHAASGRNSANARPGALAFGITSGRVAVANWRLLFLVEGLPTVALAVAVFFLLPDSPDTAGFLTPEEREVARARAILQSGQEGAARLGSFDLGEALAALAAPQTWVQPLMYFSCNVSFSSLPVFLPAVLKSMGYSSVDAQGLTAPPYLLAFIVCIGTTYLGDRTQQRGIIICVLSAVAGVGYVVLAAARSVGARYAGVFLAAAGVFPAIANTLPWVLNNHGTDAKRGVAIAMLNLVGQCGPLLGTRVFPASDGPYYVRGMAVCAAFMFFNVALAASLRAYLARENGRLEREEQADREVAGAANKTGVHAGISEVEGSFGYRYML